MMMMLLLKMISYTVCDFITNVSKTIDIVNDEDYCIIGELDNIKMFGNNMYAVLRDSNIDNNFMINIVIFGDRYKSVKNGNVVKIMGRLTLYKKNFTINVSVRSLVLIEDNGSNIEQNKMEMEKMKQLGFMDKVKKLPNDMKNIGIVTSANGAALQDILYVFKNGGYTGNIIVKNAYVQGAKCSKSVIDGIKYFENSDVDCILVTRGGGSYDDLVGFSDFDLVEHVYKCEKFVISAVGHEVDTMLIDYVSDYRAPTPSLAGEYITNVYKKHIAQELKKNDDMIVELSDIFMESINDNMNVVNELYNKCNDDKNPKLYLGLCDKVLDDMFMKMVNINEVVMESCENVFSSLVDKVIFPNMPLILGENGIVENVDNIGDNVKIFFKDGYVDANITNIVKKKKKIIKKTNKTVKKIDL